MTGDACAWCRADFYRRGRCWRCGHPAGARPTRGTLRPRATEPVGDEAVGARLQERAAEVVQAELDAAGGHLSYTDATVVRLGAALAAGAAGVDLPETVAEMLGYEERPRVAPLELGALGLRAVDRGRVEVEVRLDLVA